jgi:hypothetical protein
MLTLGPYYAVLVRLSVRSALREKHVARCGIKRWRWYGANYIDPKHLAIWFLVKSTRELDDAKAQGAVERLGAETRRQLKRHGYPAKSLSEVHIGVESDENIERGGGFSVYFH